MQTVRSNERRNRASFRRPIRARGIRRSLSSSRTAGCPDVSVAKKILPPFNSTYYQNIKEEDRIRNYFLNECVLGPAAGEGAAS